MMIDPPEAPLHAFLAASALYAEAGAGFAMAVASCPVPVHWIRPGGAGWDPALPRVGWLFPVFLGETAMGFALVGEGGDEMDLEIHDARISEALDVAMSVAGVSPSASTVRMVRSPAGADAFWIEGKWDTFVDMADARVMAAPEFLASLSMGETDFGDLVQAAEGREED